MQGLLDGIGALPPERFAVLDGAHIPGLAEALTAQGLFARPLYLEGADAEAVASGPHLLKLNDQDVARRVLAIVGTRPAAVFWSWPGGADSLYRHLRTLNMAQIARVHAPAGPDDYQTVLFRHADANVLGLMIEMMDEGQRRALLGQSPAIVYQAPKLGGARILRARQHAPVH